MNRLLIFCLVFSLMGGNAHAQFEKGKQFLGATLSGEGSFISHKALTGAQERINHRYHSIGLDLQWGVFSKQNFMFGLGLNGRYQPSLNKWEDTSIRGHSIIYGITPFVRWYKPVAGKFSLFVEPALSVSFLQSSRTQEGVRTSSPVSTSFGLGVKPGVSYRLGERFALESDLNLFYLGLNYSPDAVPRHFSFVSSMSSNLNSYFTLRGAFYLK